MKSFPNLFVAICQHRSSFGSNGKREQLTRFVNSQSDKKKMRQTDVAVPEHFRNWSWSCCERVFGEVRRGD